MIWLSFLLVIVSYIVVFKTPIGLRIRACGEHPRAADTVGINVYAVRYGSVILSGLLAAPGGVYLSDGFGGGAFTDNMTAGRGFIALAAMIFGNWRPAGAFAAAILFGFSSAIALRLQVYSASASTLFNVLPYVLTLIAVAGVIGRTVRRRPMASRTRSSSRASRRRLATAGASVAAWRSPWSSPCAAATVKPAFSACLVTGDGSPSLSNTPLGDLASAGVKAAEQQGVSGRVVRSARPSDDLASLRTCVLGGAGVTIGVGYLMAGPMNKIATEFPSRKFVIVDVAVTALASRPANVQGVLFRPRRPATSSATRPACGRRHAAPPPSARSAG